jgi:hypothetical protein
MRDHLSTCGVCHIRLVVPIRLGGAFAGLVPGGDVCVHGIGSHHPCQVCRDDVIRRKIAELEERKP